MKTYAERSRKVEVIDQIIAEPYDEDQVRLKYFPGAVYQPGARIVSLPEREKTEAVNSITVPNELLDRFCEAWLKDRMEARRFGPQPA